MPFVAKSLLSGEREDYAQILKGLETRQVGLVVPVIQ